MTETIIVTGTDTSIGKTVFAAGLAGFLDAFYWKPIQAGTEEETDSDIVRRLSGLTSERILAERWRLATPASPHLAAERDGCRIDPDALDLPEDLDRPLVVEGAGGLLVPINRQTLQIDVFAGWRAPVVLCARTALGTINHSLLSIEALRRRGMTILGVAFIGEANSDSEGIICDISGIRRLGRLPWLASLTRQTLASAFAASFRSDDFRL
ncbi:MAG TPA: dethiobiotin synthase [Beijerinckiaceae bacterium]|nr:dethiobiotin synthase [Beijerinckiaceae bacterium]